MNWTQIERRILQILEKHPDKKYIQTEIRNEMGLGYMDSKGRRSTSVTIDAVLKTLRDTHRVGWEREQGGRKKYIYWHKVEYDQTTLE